MSEQRPTRANEGIFKSEVRRFQEELGLTDGWNPDLFIPQEEYTQALRDLENMNHRLRVWQFWTAVFGGAFLGLLVAVIMRYV